MGPKTSWFAAFALVAASTTPASLARPAAPQGAAALFDDNALAITDDYSRFELALDMDGDGQLELLDWWPYVAGNDVISTGAYTRAFHPGTWWQNSETITGPPGNYGGITATKAGDFDGDGDDEFILVGREQVDVFDRFGFEFRRRLVITPPAGMTGDFREAAVLDFDGDGRDDFVTVDGSALRFYRSSSVAGSFAFTEAGSLPASDVEVDLEVADVRGSATPELFVLVPGSAPVLWIMDVEDGQLRGADRLDVRRPASGARLSLAVGDLDGDGDRDAVLFGHDGRYQVIRNAGNEWILESDALGGPATDLADLDGDGDLDGICCGSGGGGNSIANDAPSTFHLCLNVGGGAFDVAVPFVGQGGHHVAAAFDWDLDGDVDLIGGTRVLLNRTSVGASFCPGTPNSTGQAAVAYATGTQSEATGGVHLHGSGLPPQTTCILLTRELVPGSHQGGQLFWDGELCIGGTYLGRRSVAFADANGNVDLGSRATWTTPLCCELGWGGERTWGYQIWYRDVVGGGSGANVSSALTVVIAR